MEYFDELNENGEKTGRRVERGFAHENGILHATSQIYIYRYHKGRLEILLQKRSPDKDSYPGKLDISCAGHVPSGMDYDSNALKELSEELGITADISILKRIGVFRTSKKAEFYGKKFHDEQLSAVYISELYLDASEIKFQKEEISAVLWMSADEIVRRLDLNDDAFCLNPERFKAALSAIYHNIKILYSDENMTVCVKPPSVLSQGDESGNVDMLSLLKDNFGHTFYPVHRLDRNTGGVMVFAKNSTAAAKLSLLAADKENFIKEYYAVTEGQAPESGNFCDLLIKSGKKAFIAKKERKGVKKAELSFYKIAEAATEKGDYSLLCVRLLTGRFHQIRAQFSSRRLPLAGDGKYGGRDNGCTYALYAKGLEFTSPFNGEKLKFSQDPPLDYPWSLFSEYLNQ